MFKRNNGWIRCRAEMPVSYPAFLWGSCRLADHDDADKPGQQLCHGHRDFAGPADRLRRKEERRPHGWHSDCYGNTAQFPPCGLSNAPAAAVPRSPYRHLELCGIALKRCVSGFAGWCAESFSADCFASAPSKELYAANGRGFSRTLANSPLDCLRPAVARAGCSNPVTP